MPVTEKTFLRFAKLISDLAGIELAQNRKKMLVNRISNRLNALKIGSLEEYYDFVASDAAGLERQALIEAVTTHYTSFFRDQGQFLHVREELRKSFEKGRNKVRIWSAACSSGEEPYSLAIVTLEAASLAGVSKPDIRILATDISNQVLQHAYEGWFPISSLQKISNPQRSYFETQQRDIHGETMVRVSKQLRDLVIFRNVNLCECPLKIPGEIDIIFCRNVLLYFKTSKQQKIVRCVADRLRVGGLLYVGASEQVRGFLGGMEFERESVFRKVNGTHVSSFTPEEKCVANA